MTDKNPLEKVMDDFSKKIKPKKNEEQNKEVHIEVDFSRSETIRYESSLV